MRARLGGKARAMSKPSSVLIMGAGLGGLTAALALMQRGFKVRVYEQAEILIETGAGLTLPSTSMRVFDALGVWKRVRDVSADAARMAFLHYQTLELLHGTYNYAWTQKPNSPDQAGHAHRAAIHGILAEEVWRRDPGALILGRRVQHVAQDENAVRATFENGETAEGDILIGADGLRSATFRSVFGADNPARFTGVIAIRCMIPRDKRIEPYLADGRAVKYVGVKRGFVRYGLNNGTLVNCVGLARTDSWREEGWMHPCSREDFLELYADFHRDVRGLIGHAPQGRIFKWALYAREPLSSWTKDRVTMLGDAAHPMLPYLGQGATAAIEDALVLARALETHDDYSDAFKSYESERLTRTTAQMRASERQGEALNRGPGEYNQIRPSQTLLSGYDPRTVPV
jgi:salicylate hydroxylase